MYLILGIALGVFAGGWFRNGFFQGFAAGVITLLLCLIVRHFGWAFQ